MDDESDRVVNPIVARMFRERQLTMRAALEAVEWVELRYSPPAGRVCPWCDNYHDEGHKPDCQRQAALGLNVEKEA